MSSSVFCVELQVVGVAPLNQMMHLLPVGDLIAVLYEADHHCVIRKLDDGVGAIGRFAVVGEEGVEEETHHTALWYTSVYNEGGWAVVIQPDILGAVGQEVE